jgi:hypothetical protein
VVKIDWTSVSSLLAGVAVVRRPKARSAGARIRAMNMLLVGCSSECWGWLEILRDEELRQFEGWFLYSKIFQ